MFFGKKRDALKRKIWIRRVSAWGMGITIFLAILFTFVCVKGAQEFRELREATDQYIVCEKAAKQLQDGSDYLTEQVRLYAMTGDTQYREAYFQEADGTKRRETALEKLRQYFDGTDTFETLQTAQNYSSELMEREYYSMKLIALANGEEETQLEEELQETTISDEDLALTAQEQIKTAQNLVCDTEYQRMKTEIQDHVSDCMASLTTKTQNRQGRTTIIFSDIYLKLEIGIVIVIALLLLDSIVMRWLVVKPLIRYNESILRGEIFPVVGAEELQNLAITYNQVYEENQETQWLIRHQAEHDAMTDLLNKGSFEKILAIYEKGDTPFAMILVDVDIFKSVNDTYGHATGDAILKKVSSLLKSAFRSVDYVCRIGGDEFAIVLVEMTSDLKYTIQEKITAMNQELSEPTDGLPAVSLSVGVAFSDRENPGESIFKDADKALYQIKEHGKHGCGFYGEKETEE